MERWQGRGKKGWMKDEEDENEGRADGDKEEMMRRREEKEEGS